MRTWLVAAACGTILLVGGAAYVKRDLISLSLAAEQQADPITPAETAQPVRVSRITWSRPAAEATFTGVVRPHHEADLSFRASGKLLERLVSVGDRVTAGQEVARLDPADAQLDLEAAEADLAAARAELARAEAEASRSQRLLAAGHVSPAANERAATGAAEALGRVTRALRARDLAANRLDYMVLRASSDGVVTRELAEGGQVVSAGQAIVSVARTDQLDIVFALPEHKRAILEEAHATAKLWDEDSARYGLDLRDVSPDVEAATRTYRVRMAVQDADPRLTLGRTVTVTFAAAVEEPVAALPLAAVLNDGSGAAVWKLEQGRRVTRVPVEIAALEGTVALIRGGLSEGDLVVSLGAHKIDPARAVRVVETATAAQY
jgi:RND family efflux transporter MFP subunit